tara:strand:+ start:1661 stop:1879 length:219 start_codon:yes stop_codon:yes gene_type:complete
MYLGIIKIRLGGIYRGLSQHVYAVGPLYWTTTMTGYDLSGNHGGNHCSYQRDWTLWLIPWLWNITWTQVWET